MHIAGDCRDLAPQQIELIERAARLGRERFAARAADVDAHARFPSENFADLREAGLLALCVPRAQGGAGGDFGTFALVAAELGRHCGATALNWTMHTVATLWMGEATDALGLDGPARRTHEPLRNRHFGRIVHDGAVFAHSFSEGGPAGAGMAPWSTQARPVDGGYRVTGRKVFASLSGAADVYAVHATLQRPGAGLGDALLLAVPAGAPGLRVTGDWDALGMRGTASRTLELDDVFLPADACLLPEGALAQAAARCPYLFAAMAPTYFGVAQAAYDFTIAWLRGEVAGAAPVKRRMYPTKQAGVAQMRTLLEQARAMLMQIRRDAHPDPDDDARQRLYAAQYTVMEHAQAIAALALRTCGGQALLRPLPLERLYRDARCGALMLPWTAELCLDHLGRECLYDAGEGDEVIE